MNKIKMLAACLLVSGTAFAQSNAVKVNFLSAAVRVANVQYERVLNDKSSLQLGVFFGNISLGDAGEKFVAFGVTPEYRFYLGDDPAPDGFFVGPFLRYRTFGVSDDLSNEVDISLLGGGFIVGRQWLFKERVTFEVFLGPQYSSANVKVVSGEDVFENGFVQGGIGIRAGLSLGIAF